jgi:DNA-binding NtrC family response regulator
MAKPRILIVDDERDLLRVFSRALELAGYDAHTAESAEAAMALVHAAPPDAILLDLKMPFVNGLGFLYRLREAYPHLPVAIVTGMSSVDEATTSEIRALDAGLWFKPLSIAEIQAVARDLLARRPRS